MRTAGMKTQTATATTPQTIEQPSIERFKLPEVGAKGQIKFFYGFKGLDGQWVAITSSYGWPSYNPQISYNCVRFLQVSVLSRVGRRFDLSIPCNADNVTDKRYFDFVEDADGFDAENKRLFEDYMTRYTPNENKQFNCGAPVTRTSNAVMTVGSDPEIFVVDRVTNALIPAWTFLPKKNTIKAKDVISKYDCQVFWDGFQAECTPQAKECLGWHGDAVHDCLKAIAYRAKDVNGVLTPQTTFSVDPETLQNAKEEHVALGCMPSENVYGTVAQLRAESGRELSTRSAGCHIHLGLYQLALRERKTFIPRAVRMMDRLAGVSLTALLEGMEDPRRRLYYGLAGEYREPPYGVEYRTPSSACLAASWIFQYTVDIVRAAANIAWYGWDSLWQADDDEVIHVINNLDVSHARSILRRNIHVFACYLQAIYPNLILEDTMERFLQLFMRGAINVLPDTIDIMSNWYLNPGQSWRTHSNNSNACVANLVSSPKFLEALPVIEQRLLR